MDSDLDNDSLYDHVGKGPSLLSGNFIGETVANMVVPSIGRVMTMYATIRAQFLVAMVSTAARAELLKTKSAPKDLESLAKLYFGGSMPKDPFTGKDLVYESESALIYSVGENLSDDGGVKDEKDGDDDIAAQFKSE